MKYRADIDGLRALAVLSVMVYHLGDRWLPGGFTGVDVFFVISGFVVCASLAASEKRSFRGFVGEFYARRLARIIPPLAVMLVATCMLATLFIPRAWLSDLSDRTALYAFIGLSNWLLQSDADTYFAPQTDLNPYIHTWSLGVEEQFYVIFPVLCFLWVRARFHPASRRALSAVTIVACLGALSLAGSMWASRERPDAAFYSIVFRFWELAAGALLYQGTETAVRSNWQIPSTWSNLGPWFGLAVVSGGLAFADGKYFPYPWALPAVLGTMLLIGGHLAATSHPVRRALANRIVVWIGKRSYSLYLWHWPVYVLLRWTTGLERPVTKVSATAATFLLASVSYRWIESPARHNSMLKRLPPLVRIAFFLAVMASGWKIADGVLWRNDQIGLSVVSHNAIDWYADQRMPFPNDHPPPCQADVQISRLAEGTVITYRASRCTGGSVGVHRQLTVFGDSHATAYAPVFDRLSEDTGVSVTVYTFRGCGYLNLMEPMRDQPPDCLQFWQAASQQVLSAAKPDDVLFLPGLRQHRFCEQWDCSKKIDVELLALSPDARTLTVQARQEAEEWLQPFLERRMRVIFEAPKPVFRSPPFRCSDWFNTSNPICKDGLLQSRADLERLRKPIVLAMQEITSREPSVHIWDPFPLLCPTETCSAFSEGRPLFFDGDHLSAYGNFRLYPSFKKTVWDGLDTSRRSRPGV